MFSFSPGLAKTDELEAESGLDDNLLEAKGVQFVLNSFFRTSSREGGPDSKKHYNYVQLPTLYARPLCEWAVMN